MGKINDADTFELIVRLSTAILTLCLVVVGIWYTIETRGLRIAAESEIVEFKKQFHYSMMPDLYPAVTSKKIVIDSVMDGKITQTSGKTTYSKEELAEVIKHYVTIENIGNRSAYDAFLYVYNSDTKSFMKAPTYKIFVKPEKTTAIMFFDEKINYITENDLIENINEQYNINIDSVDNYIKSKDTNWLFLFYKDIQGKVYLRTRGFVRNDKGYVIHGNTDFFELN